MYAAHHDKMAAVKLLMKRGADVNARTEKGGMTALMWVAWKGNLEMVKILTENGADVNAKKENGRTALIDARECCRTTVVQYLKAHGAKE